MKILLGNNHLHSMGGTETYIYTLSSSLQKLGHTVEILLAQPDLIGTMSDKIKQDLNIEVNQITDNYDAVILNHNTTVQRFLDLKLKTKSDIYQVCHGIFNGPEIPHLGKEIKYITVSEEIQNHIKINFNQDSVLIRNLIDIDLYTPTQISKTPKVLYSLAQSDDMNDLLQSICNELDIKFLSNNKNSNFTSSVKERLELADIVVSLGRGCYEAMAMGKSVLVADKRSYMPDFMEGMVDSSLFPNFIKKNCSGRFYKHPVNRESIKKEILKYNPDQGILNRELINTYFNSITLTKQILKLF
jgi:hypothetical protein